MRSISRSFILLLCLFLVAGPLSAGQGGVPVSLFIDMDVIELNKEKAEAGNKEIQKAIDQLIANADERLTEGPFSVVFSKKNSPHGSVHDYCSMSPYWWPDSTKEDGLPYIRKDGVVNPERNEYDKTQSGTLREVIEVLAYAYLYTGDEKYSQRVVELLKVWFVNEKTHMNPNMTFAQFIPGRSTGRNFGIIESRVFMYALDYASVLYQMGQMNDETYGKLYEWNKEFLNWLVNSEHGQKEHNAKNNHGTWYDTQTLGFAVLVGDIHVQKNIVSEFIERRIKGHILPSGEQLAELTRTRAFSYSNFNLNAMTEFYTLALKNDLLTKKESRIIKNGILRAAKYVYTYALDPDKWPYQQIKSFDGGRMQLAQTYFTLDKLYPGKNHWKKAMSIPQDPYNRSVLMLRNDMFKENK
jgi:Alginate lyase